MPVGRLEERRARPPGRRAGHGEISPVVGPASKVPAKNMVVRRPLPVVERLPSRRECSLITAAALARRLIAVGFEPEPARFSDKCVSLRGVGDAAAMIATVEGNGQCCRYAHAFDGITTW